MLRLLPVRVSLALLLAFSLCWPTAADAKNKDKKKQNADESTPYFNEVFNPDGTVREPYRDALAIIQDLSKKKRDKFPEKSTKKFSGDTPLTALPRMLSADEFEEVAHGTAQRARALQAFYTDYLGEQKFRQDGIIPGAIIDAIVDRTGEGAFRKFLTPEAGRKMRAFYGPDAIRGKDGKWYALEDNLNFVGGAGDVEGARAVHEKLIPQFGRRIGALNHPVQFLNEVMDRSHQLASPAIGDNLKDGAFVVYGTPPYGDEEDHRLYTMLKARGAVVVEPESKDKKIEVRPDGAYLVLKTGFGVKYEKKIGFLWMNAEHAWVDWKHPAIREKALLDEAREHLEDEDIGKKSRKRIEEAMQRDPQTRQIDLAKLEKALKKSNVEFEDSVLGKPYVPGLLEAILDGRVQTNASPGTEFMGDKMFYSYVPDLIRYYLKEEPIIHNVPTERLFEMGSDGQPHLNREALQRAMENRESKVAKVVDGRGGDGIHIGPKMSEKEWRALEKVLSKEMTRYIIQDFTHPSVLSDGQRPYDDRIVDIRFVSFISDDGHVIVSGTPWGRSNVLEGGDGKVNMSKSGTETTVYIVDKNGRLRQLPTVFLPGKCGPEYAALYLEE